MDRWKMQAKGEARESPVRASMEDWEIFSRRRSSASSAPCKSRKSKGGDSERGDSKGGQEEQGSQGQAAGGLRLWTVALGRSWGCPAAAPGMFSARTPSLGHPLPAHTPSRGPALPLGTSPAELDEGAAHTPCSSQPSGHWGHIWPLGLSHPASPCPAVLVCLKPDSLAREASLSCLLRNVASSVQTLPPQVLPSTSAMWRSCVPGPGSTEPLPDQPQPLRAPSLGMSPPGPAPAPLHKPQSPGTFCCWETWASPGAQHIGSPTAHASLQLSPPQNFTQEKIKQHLHCC